MSWASEPYELLPWDTEFFKFPVGRLIVDRLDAKLALCADQWAKENRVRCLYFLAPVDDPASVQAAREHDYDLVDIRMTLEHRGFDAESQPNSGSRVEVPIRLAQPQDLAALEAMARTGHRDTRFFRDSHFPQERAEELYSTWIRLECQGRATQVLVAASSGGRAQGYVSCHLNQNQGFGQIGLVGVGSECRGRGIGRALILAALDWFAGKGVRETMVVTQGRNFLAQRLYQRCGFVTKNLQLWYHKWFPAQPGSPVST